MTMTQVTAVIGAAASLLCTLVVGALTYFVKKMMSDLEAADKANAAAIRDEAHAREEKLEELAGQINDLKSDLPLIYVLREDFFRSMQGVDDKFKSIDSKLDHLINIISSGKEG